MKAILIDDEELALDFLENQLHKVGDIDIIGKFNNPFEALEQISSSEFNVAFIDINMPEINGLELAESIQNKLQEILIVFVTAYDEYAVSAFEINALDYIVKPIQINRLQQTVERVKSKLKQKAIKLKPSAHLYITVCQQLFMSRSKDNLCSISWRTAKVEELFLYLLQNQGKLVRKAFLAELLWPDLNPDRSFAQLYTAIYHVRSKLRDFGVHFDIKSSMEGYILESTRATVDLQEWERRISILPPLNEKSIKMYENAMKINTGPFLADYDYLWAEPIRENYEQQWLKLSFQLAEYYFDNNMLRKAITWYNKINIRHPTIEDPHFSLMQIYAIQQEYSLVRQQFDKMNKILAEQLDVFPSESIVTWYENWKKRHYAH